MQKIPDLVKRKGVLLPCGGTGRAAAMFGAANEIDLIDQDQTAVDMFDNNQAILNRGKGIQGKLTACMSQLSKSKANQYGIILCNWSLDYVNVQQAAAVIGYCNNMLSTDGWLIIKTCLKDPSIK
jgi:hypothetical protein